MTDDERDEGYSLSGRVYDNYGVPIPGSGDSYGHWKVVLYLLTMAGIWSVAGYWVTGDFSVAMVFAVAIGLAVASGVAILLLLAVFRGIGWCIRQVVYRVRFRDERP